MSKILIVEDEPDMVVGLKDNFEFEGYEVATASDGQSGLEQARAWKPDLIVLDVMLPRLSGLEVCKTLRSEGYAGPILMLTARGQEIDKVVGLELGADDYVTKPFSPRELAARVRAVLRRTSVPGDDSRERIEVAGLVIDAARHSVLFRDRPISLTPTEFRLLWTLAGRPGRAFSRGQLLAEALGDSYEGYERTIDAHVKNLRAKLSRASCSARIETVYGVGYRLLEAIDG